jgi:hypothetical protein
MPIDQAQITLMLAECVDANNVGRKVYFCEGGNLMTAMNYYRKITGQQFDLGVPLIPLAQGGQAPPATARTATFSSPAGPVKSFKFNTYSELVGGINVSVTLRGGSSSPVQTERYVLTSGDATGQTVYTHGLPGVPTMEFQNAWALTAVLPFQALGDRIVEVKFTTRYEFTSAKDYYVSH